MCDFYSFCVGILSALVTALIGWQVIDYFTLKRNIKKMIGGRADAIVSDYHTVLDGIVRLNLYSHDLKDDCALLTDNCFECLLHISKCKDKRLCRFAVGTVMDLLHELCVHYNGRYSIYEGKKSLYFYILSDIDSPYKKDIAEAIGSSAKAPCEGNRVGFDEAMTDAEIEAAIAAAE